MKITAFDNTYPEQLASGGSLLTGSSGGSNSAAGGDVTGEAGSLSVIGLSSTISLASNMGGSVGDVLMLVQTGPRVAQFSTPSNLASFGSNASRVSEAATGGAATTYSRADHIHDGIGTVTASSSNTMQRGTVNLRAGSNVAFGLTDTDGDGELDTITVNAPPSPAAISALGFRGELLISSTPSNPIVFGDVMLNSDGTDFVYATIPE